MVKVKLKFFKDIISKLYQTFKWPCSLHKPRQTICFILSSLFLSVSVSEFVVKNIRRHLLFSRSSCGETLLLQKQLIPDPFDLKSISLLLISATLHYLLIIPSCHAVGEETSEPETSYLMKTLLLLLTKSPNARKFFFSPYFLSFFYFFVFVFWPIETTITNFQSLIETTTANL